MQLNLRLSLTDETCLSLLRESPCRWGTEAKGQMVFPYICPSWAVEALSLRGKPEASGVASQGKLMTTSMPTMVQFTVVQTFQHEELNSAFHQNGMIDHVPSESTINGSHCLQNKLQIQIQSRPDLHFQVSPPPRGRHKPSTAARLMHSQLPALLMWFPCLPLPLPKRIQLPDRSLLQVVKMVFKCDSFLI